MRRMLLAAVAIVFSTTLVALAQKTPDPATAKADDKSAADKATADKSKALEELLAKALQNSPDVQVAEARLKEAEAGLRQARLLVAQKTVDLQQTMEQKQSALSLIESRYKQASLMRNSGTVSSGEVAKIEAELAAQKSQLAQVEAQVNMLIGKFPVTAEVPVHSYNPVMLFARARQLDPFAGTVAMEGALGGGGGAGDPILKRQPQSSMSDRLRKLLNTNFKVPEQHDNTPLPDVIEKIREGTGAPILTKGLHDHVVKLDFKGDVTLAAFFQMLCDTVPSLTICVRDYGFFITTEGPPDDAVMFMDFLKAGDKSSK